MSLDKFKLAEFRKMDPEVAIRIMLLHLNAELKGDDEPFGDFTIDVFSIPVPQFYFISLIYDPNSVSGGIKLKVGIKNPGGGNDSSLLIHTYKISNRYDGAGKQPNSFEIGYHISYNGANPSKPGLAKPQGRSGMFHLFKQDCWGSYSVNTDLNGRIIICNKFKDIEDGERRVFNNFIEALFINSFCHRKKEKLLSSIGLVDKLAFDTRDTKILMLELENLLNIK
jgi:hypothetical protein